MIPAVWQYWFPIALTVAAGAALLGKPRAHLVVLIGAAYWPVLALAEGSPGASTEPAVVLGILLGSAAIAAIGLWMSTPRSVRARAVEANRHQHETPPAEAHSGATLSEIAPRFEAWMAEHRSRPDPWPDFGEFINSVLHETCGAKHVRAYRLLATDDDVLFPLRCIEPGLRDFPTARIGIVGHVVTTGKSFYANDAAQGELVAELATGEGDGKGRHTWCFAIQQDHRTIGVVCVGEADADCLGDRAKMRLSEGLVQLCWTVLTESCRSRLADETDPISGVLTHTAFSRAASRALTTAYEKGEPIAIVNVSVEGLRWFADHGQWDFANQTLYEISSLLKQRLRDEDEIGVFDGSRFLILLRRVDSALAMLIVRKLMERVSELCANRSPNGGGLRARCGVAGSGLSRPTLHTLIARATEKCQEARMNDSDLAADLDGAPKAVQS